MSDEAKICDKCFDVQSPYTEETYCESCGGRVFFEVDELIAPAISVLNKKGYITQFCCSGHIHLGRDYIYRKELGTYVLFYDVHKFSKVPPEFQFETMTLDSGLRSGLYLERSSSRHEETTYSESLSLLFDAIKALQLWADSLPNRLTTP